MTQRTDVAIVGGGLAGLGLALQLTDRLPDCCVTVIDRGRRPAQERIGTVGESFAELGSHYLRDVLGLEDHLEADELPKYGLRFYVGDADDLHDRFEIGVLEPFLADVRDGCLVGLPLRTHQVDRARLENEMARRCRARGVRMVEGTRVDDCDLDPGGHVLRMSGDGPGRLQASWVVFASGPEAPPASIERRKLGHGIRAAWFRVEGALDVGTWSAHEAYRDAAPGGFRRLSTNHFMGPGYWVWLIPLPSGVTSVGIVCDGSSHEPFPETFEGLLHWLRARDRRLASELGAHRPVDPAPRTVSAEAFVCRSVHPERWAVIGGAAAFVDVLYSPGADLIALGNTLLAGVIERDRSDGRVAGPAALANRVFEGFSDGLAEIYRGHYPNFGRPEVVGTKTVWDSALYFGFNTLLFRHGLATDPAFLSRIQPELHALRAVQSRVQARFRSDRVNPVVPSGTATVEWGHVDWMMKAYLGAKHQTDEDAVLGHLRAVLSSLEEIGRRIEGRA